MATKKKKKDPIEMVAPTIPLSGVPWTGADNNEWMDVSVDSDASTGIFWIRKRVHDNCYFLIVATVGGHVLKKEVSKEEAVYLYTHMKHRVQHEVAFGKIKRTKNASAA